VSLHNKYPSHFYKRDKQESPAHRPRKAPFRPNAAAQKLEDFARRHMSLDEAHRLLQLISEANGLPSRPPSRYVWGQLGWAASVGLPQERVERYLTELEDRLRAGRQLIQR
jgi:hypothetical protein